LLLVDPGDEVGDLIGLEVVDTQRGASPPAFSMKSPVSSIVSGRSMSDGPVSRLLRPVA
jgi:hypothetical protein